MTLAEIEALVRLQEKVRDLVYRYLNENRHLEPTVNDIMDAFHAAWERACAAHEAEMAKMVAARESAIDRADAAEARVRELEEERERVWALAADLTNQFALYFTKDGVEMVGTGGLSDLEAAFQFFHLPDPCKLAEFRAALAN